MKSVPDGTTVWITSVGAAAINPSLHEKLAYDMARDFAPVSMVVNNVEVLVINTNDKARDAADCSQLSACFLPRDRARLV